MSPTTMCATMKTVKYGGASSARNSPSGALHAAQLGTTRR